MVRSVAFEKAAEMAAKLSPDEQQGLVSEIEDRLVAMGMPQRGTGAAIIEAMKDLPPVSKEDVEALERAIEEGKRPATTRGIFDDEQESRG
jgi:hypothetical protein